MNEAKLKMRHEAHVADLMAKAISLMMYQTEATHTGSALQTALVTALSEAKEAARNLANNLAAKSDGMSDVPQTYQEAQEAAFQERLP